MTPIRLMDTFTHSLKHLRWFNVFIFQKNKVIFGTTVLSAFAIILNNNCLLFTDFLDDVAQLWYFVSFEYDPHRHHLMFSAPHRNWHYLLSYLQLSLWIEHPLSWTRLKSRLNTARWVVVLAPYITSFIYWFLVSLELVCLFPRYNTLRLHVVTYYM